MKTVVKIDPEKEYQLAKDIIESLTNGEQKPEDLPSLDSSVDNLKTVINVLIERATPKPRATPKKTSKNRKNRKPRSEFDKLPSQKFPHLKVNEEIFEADESPSCPCCNKEMKPSGLYKTSEKLEVIPKQYYITRTKRVIYNCQSCHGSMTNAPSKPSISRSSNYGDSLIIDAVLSKYCDLIPIERYCAMAAREGINGIPPNSIITISHAYATFLLPIYKLLMAEVLGSNVIYMDETPHNMLEGDDTRNWYLWGFSSPTACLFEAHNTRSGDVPFDFLVQSSNVRFIVTDGYKGYARAIRLLGEQGKVILEVFCNAHAYRYFRDASSTWTEETEPFLEAYGQIFELERQSSSDSSKQLARNEMKPFFDDIKRMSDSLKTMPGSTLEKAKNYFLNHYEGLTQCLSHPAVPLDNNASERLLRSPVVGRKTWSGTHSKRGAQTASIMFSIVESCKLNQINPRNYFTWVTDRIHAGQSPMTPHAYTKIDSG